VQAPRVEIKAPVAHIAPQAPAAIEAAPVVQPDPPPSEPASVTKSVTKRAVRVTEHAESAPASPEAELALLREAQSALNRSASAALTLADEHARLYPNGVFVQEREMLRIEAELTLGKRRDALERAHAFAERFASSTYRARIDRLLETHRSLKKQETAAPQRTH
jgi:RNA polymerase sigma-70 factor (ECF subfamily)